MFVQDSNNRRTHKLKHNTYSDRTKQSVASVNQKITNAVTEISNKIDLSQLEPRLMAVYDEVMQQVGDRDYALECLIRCLTEKQPVEHPIIVAHNPTLFFAVAVGSTVTIPFQTIVDNHADYVFAGGIINPKRKGWYNVYCYIYDDFPGGAYTYNLHILGNGSIGIVDFHIGNRMFKMAGQQYVFCDGETDTISAALSHNADIMLAFNYNVGWHHKSYITVSFVGDEESAFIV